jgi:hypothetical protein
MLKIPKVQPNRSSLGGNLIFTQARQKWDKTPRFSGRDPQFALPLTIGHSDGRLISWHALPQRTREVWSMATLIECKASGVLLR